MPIAVATSITRSLAWSCPHTILCFLGLDQVMPTVILYFRPPTAYMPLQDIEQLTSLSSAGPHIWVFRCRMPPPLLRVQGYYSTAWTEMGDHHPSPAPPCPQTPGPGLAAFRTSHAPGWVSPVAPAETRYGLCSTFSFLLIFPLY